MKKTKEKRPDWKAQFEALKAGAESAARTMNENLRMASNSNNQAIADIQELVRLKTEAQKAQAALDQSFAAIEKKLREVRSAEVRSVSPWFVTVR